MSRVFVAGRDGAERAGSLAWGCLGLLGWGLLDAVAVVWVGLYLALCAFVGGRGVGLFISY